MVADHVQEREKFQSRNDITHHYYDWWHCLIDEKLSHDIGLSSEALLEAFLELPYSSRIAGV
jgi:hypothetical protein